MNHFLNGMILQVEVRPQNSKIQHPWKNDAIQDYLKKCTSWRSLNLLKHFTIPEGHKNWQVHMFFNDRNLLRIDLFINMDDEGS